MRIGRACTAALLGLMLLAAGAIAQSPGVQGGESGSMLDTLFAKLQTATDPVAVQELEQAIWEQWTMLPDEAQRKLMFRGIAEMQQQELESAVATFTRLIELAPKVSEGWNKRATLYYTLGEYKKSLADCDEVIKRNPLHFGALSGYGLIYVQLNQPARAIEYFKRALKINPNLRGVEESINVLEQQGKRGRGSYI